MRVVRVPTLILLLVSALTLGASPHGGPPVDRGMPPERVPEGDGFVLEGVCDFAVELAFAGKEGAMFLPRFDLFTAPGFRVAATALDEAGDPTERSLSAVISGTFRDVFNDDGSLTTHASGNNLLLGLDPGEGEPFLLLTRGKAVLHFPDAGNFDEFTVVEARHVVDVCEALAD